MANNIIDNTKVMDSILIDLGDNEERAGFISSEKHTYTVHTINLSEQVTTSYGKATFEEDSEEMGLYHFEISLGPANSMKLISFLLSLPHEPNEG